MFSSSERAARLPRRDTTKAANLFRTLHYAAKALDMPTPAKDDCAVRNTITAGSAVSGRVVCEVARRRDASSRPALRWSVRVALCGLALAVGFPRTAHAQIGSPRYSSLVMRESDGNIVSSFSPDEPRFPASLTKMMTLYMVFEALRDRRITLGQRVPVSAHAAAMEPSKLGLLPGTVVNVQQLIMGLVTKSANDGAAALGEMLGGSEDRFAQMMTLRARALGMSRTVFRNASGLPDPDQVSTARDLALLARHLIDDFPEQYRYFSLPSFIFHGRAIPNHDHMLQSYPGADGIKTGYTEASGFNLVTSAVRGDVRLIGVVLGAARPFERDQQMASLLDAAYVQLGVPVQPRREAPNRLNLVAATPAPGLAMAPSLAVPPVPPHHGGRPVRPARTVHPAHGRSIPSGHSIKPTPHGGGEASRQSNPQG